MAPTAPVTNPLLEDWSKNSVYGLPPFDRISAEHFKPAFEVAFKEHKNDVRAIAQNPEVPTFENTIASLDRAGDLVDNVGSAFSTLCSSRSSKELQAVQRDMAGPLSDHYSSIKMEPGLFARIDSLQKQKEAGTLPGPVLTAEQSRLLDRFHLDFIRAGAKFGESEQSRYAAILKVLAEKTTAFQQNIVADEAEWILELNDNDQDLAGLPDFLRDSARAAAKV
jgi:peptidyl-dipeptidase Dcp